MTLTWVIGSGGLLGGSLVRALRAQNRPLFTPSERFSWREPAKLPSQIASALNGFARAAEGAKRWEIYWAAGIGTMGSREADLAPETAALDTLLTGLAVHPRLDDKPGTFSFASSAGAIYAGAPGQVITEATPPAPTTIYALSKLRQEERVADFVRRRGVGTSALMARLSTLYGTGQAGGKSQGLITHVARQIVRNGPVNIFVPLDTIRDYIAVEDAVAQWIAATRVAAARSEAQVKIIASERPTTIAEIVSLIRRFARRRLPVVTSANAQTAAYTRCVQFRSEVLPLSGLPAARPLALGVAQILAEERVRRATGSRG